MFERLAAIIAADPRVRVAYLFGSRARGEARRDSDVDVAVLLDEPIGPWERGAFAERLEAVSGTRVEVVDLASAPPVLQMEVVRDGRLLHARSAEEDVDFRVGAMRRYQDTQHLRDVQARHLSSWARERGHGPR